ncbi:MAG: choice-of-anchor V domain-containing protein, partial [Flavobacteriales bacterium]
MRAKSFIIFLGVFLLIYGFKDLNKKGHHSSHGSGRYENSAPPPAGVTGSPGDGGTTCAKGGCHTGVSVTSKNGWITSNIPAAGYKPDSTYTITAKAINVGGSKFGFELTVEDTNKNHQGNLIVTNSTTTTLTGPNNNYIAHTSNGTSGNDSLSWSFEWKAPSSKKGEITFYAAFNLADGNNISSNDTIRTSSLSVNYNCNTYSTINPTVCDTTYTVPSGDETYTTNGTYEDTISNNGCDSLITINLTLNAVDTSVTKSNDTLKADLSGASYQWLDCDSGNAAISGETNQTFVPVSSGNYAVEVTKNGCTDTSFCRNVTITDIEKERVVQNGLEIYPNPANEFISIKNRREQDVRSVMLTDIKGRIIIEKIQESFNDRINIPLG